ncbi:hypothetical protein SAMN04488040_0554 [Sulfitobacter marinus]|uniref:Glyceraldehyde-3-phosphate dehydrogenase n=1 Tax=Sulfitobacter marinus TaxID=394264 RepID=A0A1I6Q7Y1_9RHOB|nr:hypothetical protein [Sulfitobacter marinus]SFS48532.1 hypothetical protein SAMN04488040_0554 [Sulfitobacter marinus]
MNTPIALALALLVILGVIVDVTYFGSEHLLFLTKKFLDLLEWVAFWR